MPCDENTRGKGSGESAESRASHKKKAVWPVMLTPFTDSGSVDYRALEALIDWYEGNGVHGLFAVCQSSEMYYLSLRERVDLASFIKRRAGVPVIASGHISCSPEDQLEELKRIAGTGVDAVILLTNRMARRGESPDVWKANLERLLDRLNGGITLGLYECPHPYKRLLTPEELALCASTGRFRFLKDTSCDISLIRDRLKVLEGSPLELYNANTSTLLDSLRFGAAGFSGVMANFHPELYVWLAENWDVAPDKASLLQSVLSVCSFIEGQAYPVNAKYHLQNAGLPITTYTRSRDRLELTPLYQDEVVQMDRLAKWVRQALSI